MENCRADHRLQGLRDRIFPSKGKNTNAPENVPPVTLPTKSREDSLSSLKASARKAKTAAKQVVTPRGSDISFAKHDKVARNDGKHRGIEILDEVSTILSARRAKVVARKKFIQRESTPPSQPDKVTGDEKEDYGHSQSNGTSKTRVQKSSKPESRKQIVPKKTYESTSELCKEKVDMSEPLTSLVEAVRRNKSSNKSPMKEVSLISVPIDSSDNDSLGPKVQVKKHDHTGENKESSSAKLKRLLGNQERTMKSSGDLNFPVPAPVTGSSSESNNKFGNLPFQPVIGSSGISDKIFGTPVWLSLVASEDKEVGARLAQISTPFIRVKLRFQSLLLALLVLDMCLCVEILLWGQPVLSSWKLQNLVELWLQTMPKDEKIHTFVGSSAKDFVMVLSYGLKA
ncbi:unnamed protein product [Lupinus luteus]|uniref:Uncharacterized protein n=1 Tax=Lupinus luteus TaxID=3873 RepID=A0AAV1VSH1_LUPLU